MPNQNQDPQGPKRRNSIFMLVLISLVIVGMFNLMLNRMSAMNTEEISYDEFLALVASGQVKSVELDTNRYTLTMKTQEELDEEAKNPQTEAPTGEDPDSEGFDTPQELLDAMMNTPLPDTSTGKTIVVAPLNIADFELKSFLDSSGVEYFSPMPQENSLILSMLINVLLPMALVMVIFLFLMRRMGGGMGGMGGVGKANAKVYMERSTGVTFEDVAGQDEAKESLQEIIDFLHSPRKYTEIGAKLPKGALLVGSPGTGKTLMAKAVAGEAGVPFFSISGSDFVEMFVGVGASRVRDLFKEAAKVAPCIIFIDEVDTIGKSRDNRMGGNDEREQTLNQLLAELDGFDPTKGVIVLAATNRPEVLDKALLRPGRFDRRITVDRPNLAGRLATLQVHTKKIRLSDDVDLPKLAQATAGCVGADLANLVNEAALRAVRMGRKMVNQRDLLASFEHVIAGAEKKGTVLTEREKQLIAFHEVGHALVSALQKDQDPVTKITIVPHTQGALGFTMQTPEEERFLMDRDELYGRIRVLLAGRCAEELVFNAKTTGAGNDIERATDLARKMITMYGMSDKFGMVALATVQSQYLDGSMSLTCAQDTAAAVDEEIRRIMDTCHDEALAMLRENREKLDEISNYLLKKETITGVEFTAILEGRDPAEVAEPEEVVVERPWVAPRDRKPEPEESEPEDISFEDSDEDNPFSQLEHKMPPPVAPLDLEFPDFDDEEPAAPKDPDRHEPWPEDFDDEDENPFRPRDREDRRDKDDRRPPPDIF